MIAITQPTYFPWAGYFSLIDQSNKFVFFDDVQFDRSSWQQRNIILNKNKPFYLTVPVKKKGKRFQQIREVRVFSNDFFEDHLKIIKHSYSNSKYFDEIFPQFEEIKYKISKINSLSEINIILIKKICEIIKIDSDFKKSSDINTLGDKTSKIINICNKLKINQYLTVTGAKEYIESDLELFKNHNIKVLIQHYENKKYSQMSNVFISKLSVLDLIFNEGPNSLKIIRSGFNNEIL